MLGQTRLRPALPFPLYRLHIFRSNVLYPPLRSARPRLAPVDAVDPALWVDWQCAQSSHRAVRACWTSQPGWRAAWLLHRGRPPVAALVQGPTRKGVKRDAEQKGPDKGRECLRQKDDPRPAMPCGASSSDPAIWTWLTDHAVSDSRDRHKHTRDFWSCVFGGAAPSVPSRDVY